MMYTDFPLPIMFIKEGGGGGGGVCVFGRIH